MKVLNSMKLGAILIALLLSGCATTSEDYVLYLDAQKSLSRDLTMMEASRILALVEMTKSNDPAVKATGLMLLQQLQQGSKSITIEPPKKGILGF